MEEKEVQNEIVIPKNKANFLLIISAIGFIYIIIDIVSYYLGSRLQLPIIFLFLELSTPLFLVIWFFINLFKKNTKINTFFQRHKIVCILIIISLVCGAFISLFYMFLLLVAMFYPAFT
ncbi:hypothetical protein AGMMS50249_2000 [candidate division SR1 bacterium]|nr:hypothetical protein AGMMS50249_2000 [candidate division SR1 bacterium]